MGKGKCAMGKWTEFSFEKAAFLLLSLLPLTISLPAKASDVYLGLQAYGGAGKALGVGLLPFNSSSANPETGSYADKLRAVVREDLLFPRYFNIVEGGPPIPAGGKIDSVTWGSLGAQVAIAGDVKLEGATLSLECRIVDV